VDLAWKQSPPFQGGELGMVKKGMGVIIFSQT